jgi:uncharacterized protein (UPF0332 family)
VSDDPKDLAKFWFEKADDSLAAAKELHERGREDAALNRAYYAAFYAATAAFALRKKQFKRHSSLRSAVHEDLVRSGELAAKWAGVFDRLSEARQRADYIALVHIEADEAEALRASR